MKQVTVTTTETELESLETTSTRDKMAVQVRNAGSVALSAFSVKFKATEENNYLTHYSQESDWTTIPSESFIQLAVSEGSATNPVTLAAGEEFLFYLEGVSGYYGVQFTAAVASGETIIEIGAGAGN